MLEVTIAERTGLSWRSVSIGLGLTALIALGAPYTEYIVHTSLVTVDYFPLAAVFPFLLVVILNVAAGSICPKAALSTRELVVVFIMALMASALATAGLASYLLATIAAPYYFATPENRWADDLQPHIPRWVVPRDEGKALTYFFEGLPKGQSIPWGAWAIPLFWWATFILAFFTCALCLVVILRKQWVEHERIIFPLAEVPVELIQRSPTGGNLPAILRNRLFWAGFAVPFFVIIWNLFGYFTPVLPPIPIGQRTSIALTKDFPGITAWLRFSVLGFAFLANLEISFSLWFFHVLSIVQTGIYNRVGFVGGPGETYVDGHPAIAWQGFGGMAVMVFWGLWMARRHLRDVFMKAAGKAPHVDDSDEFFSYRKAVIGLILGTVYIVAWLCRSGLSPLVVGMFLFCAFVLYLGVARIVAEGGLVYLRGPIVPQIFVAYALGPSAISASSLVGLAFTYAWIGDLKVILMPYLFHSVKIGETLKLHRKTVYRAIIITLVAAGVTAIWYTLYLGYQHGAYNYGRYAFRGGATIPYDSAVGKIRNPFGPDTGKLLSLGGGALAMAAMIFMRYRFPWWSLNPIGFTVATTLPVTLTVLPIFLAWAAKYVILKLGGIQAYRKAQPFFLGLIIGEFAGSGIALVVDAIWFVGQGHELTGW